MKISSQWVGERCFVASNATGQSVVMDGIDTSSEGVKRGASPMELLLMGVAGCSSIDIVEIVKKQRQDILDCITTVQAERATTVPKIFTKIHIHFQVMGRNLDEAAVAKAVQLSAEKYCSASIMFGKITTLTHSFEVVQM